jgi:hypothetical protein
MSARKQGTCATTSSSDCGDSAARFLLGRLTRPVRPLAMLATAGLLSGFSLQAMAAPPPPNRIFFDCTFTTTGLQTFLGPGINVNQFVGGTVRASYILIYVRENPNDGQAIKNPPGAPPTFTGPILCRNSDNTNVVPTTQTTPIPGAPGTTVDILGAEEALHLQYRRNADNVIEKRVCHTVAGNVDCFLIQPKP